jgi:hypothetical protein
MDDKKVVYESEVIGLPPLTAVLGEVPSPDPDRRRNVRPVTGRPGREMIVPVRRLIAHLEGKPTR